MSTVEILAPAGSADALKAAVRCGAAAVYLGTDHFNARQHAANFSGEALDEAVRYCHARGVQVHLTLNTLLRADEIEDALAVARRACKLGIDALIVQDVGLARRLRAAAPDMPLHASTQLACHTPDGVRFLRDNGFSRVVLAREMTLDEIRACAGLQCELEVFVHGALCMCVSGQCYLSAALGGRSGNRGLCAQPCRLPFSAPGTSNRTGGFALSLKDQSLIQHIPALRDAGVISLKIEGRMKRPEYVAAAVTACRAAADGTPLSEDDLRKLTAVFSRSGFTDGYLTGKRGSEMFGIRRQEDVEAALPVLKTLQQLYHKERQSIPVSLHLTAAPGQPSILSAVDQDGHTVTVKGPAALPARTAATTAERAAAQLCKTGDTPFAVTAAIDMAPNTMLPAAALNALRRESLTALEKARAAAPPVTFRETAPSTPSSSQSALPFRRLVRLSSVKQYSQALSEETVMLPLSAPADVWQMLRQCHRGLFGAEIPRGLFGGTDKLEGPLTQAKNAGASFLLCNNINAIPAARKTGLPLIGGFGLHITNTDARDFYIDNGFAALTLSPELSFAQMRFAENSTLPLGLFAYGRLPLMLTRNCPYRAAGADCGRCRGHGMLSDRRQTCFPVMCQNGCAELLNSVPHDWADQQRDFPKLAFFLFHFTDETAEQTASVLDRYDMEEKTAFPFTRGLYRRGVD